MVLLDHLWDISRSPPVYRATMFIQRFKYLLKFIRFDDGKTRDKSDRLSPIRFIFERFVKQLPQHYVPNENMTVDEQLVPFRGRCRFVPYTPSKPAKYGLKFWTLSDAYSRYVLGLDLYTGKKNNMVRKNLVLNVVLDLVDQLPKNIQQGRTVTFDRYFTDIKLCDALLERKMTSIGVVEHRRVFLPNELKLCRKKLSTHPSFTSPVHICFYPTKLNKRKNQSSCYLRHIVILKFMMMRKICHV